jgi:hypothetical protein
MNILYLLKKHENMMGIKMHIDTNSYIPGN